MTPLPVKPAEVDADEPNVELVKRLMAGRSLSELVKAARWKRKRVNDHEKESEQEAAENSGGLETDRAGV